MVLCYVAHELWFSLSGWWGSLGRTLHLFTSFCKVNFEGRQQLSWVNFSSLSSQASYPSCWFHFILCTARAFTLRGQHTTSFASSFPLLPAILASIVPTSFGAAHAQALVASRDEHIVLHCSEATLNSPSQLAVLYQLLESRVPWHQPCNLMVKSTRYSCWSGK